MYWNDHGMNGWGVGLMVLTVLLLLGLLAVVAVVALRALGHPVGPRPAPRRPEPEQLLAERLARGEIDPDEYRRRLEALSGAPGPGKGADGTGWTP
ncbi:SHOCT domain-containing protein [Kitasatospora cineracea]|uniref:Membrane protein n=1 Tax=Kitasatospora cineracea TaxID=88074 RepID=A0A3N4RY87_9ACTN|nr:SHOCT domain-containing protein [Kitasatospora cineracea]ROR45576.1 putative membrane protein [Kitasatospora cineracea]RPE35929.1 putative membrane protein [Kitasatospora cineracea]